MVATTAVVCKVAVAATIAKNNDKIDWLNMIVNLGGESVALSLA